MKNFKKLKTGFTLVEMLVAISILSLSILASFTAVSNNLQTSFITEDKITAYYLASEAVDFIRNMRDENGIKNIQAIGVGSSVHWLSGFAQGFLDPCYNKVCIIDSPFKTITACSGNSSTCPLIKQDPVTKLYGYSPFWQNTYFNRSITITSISPVQVRIDVLVSWLSQNNIVRNYTLSEIITDWQ
jgi:prepilin-type N-terminal cleavage/methylation domain-containing protein